MSGKAGIFPEDLAPQQVILEQDRLFYNMLLGFTNTHCNIEITHPLHGKWKLTLTGEHTIPPPEEDIPIPDKQMPFEQHKRADAPEVFSPRAVTSSMSLADMDDMESAMAIGPGKEEQWEDI